MIVYHIVYQNSPVVSFLFHRTPDVARLSGIGPAGEFFDYPVSRDREAGWILSESPVFRCIILNGMNGQSGETGGKTGTIFLRFSFYYPYFG